MSAGRTVTAVPSNGVVESIHFDELDQFDALHHQLSDSIAAIEHDGRPEIVVDQADLDLPAVSSVDGARGVDDRQSRFGRQARARVDQPHHPEGQGHRNPRAHENPFAGSDRHWGGDPQIHTRVTLVRTRGNR